MSFRKTSNRWWYWELLALIFLTASTVAAKPGDDMPGRDPKQAIDTEYTQKILEYTTQPMFASPLVDYLPASKTVPTPKAVLATLQAHLVFFLTQNRFMSTCACWRRPAHA